MKERREKNKDKEKRSKGTRNRWVELIPDKRERTFIFRALSHAKSRAKKLGLAFDLLPEEIKIPKECPLLSIPLSFYGGDSAPSLDRIDNSKGYTKDNCWVISNKANRMKNNASLIEWQTFCLNSLASEQLPH